MAIVCGCVPVGLWTVFVFGVLAFYRDTTNRHKDHVWPGQSNVLCLLFRERGGGGGPRARVCCARLSVVFDAAVVHMDVRVMSQPLYGRTRSFNS